MIVVVLGVSGCGKSTIGQLLAEQLQLPFYDGDDFHPKANILKMESGKALNDKDRLPWLQNLAKQIANWEIAGGAVLACSALKEPYRKILRTSVPAIQWIHLSGSIDLIKNRLAQRRGHFMPLELLQSQFDTLEIPNYAWQIDIREEATQIVERIITRMNAKQSFFGVIGLGVMGKSISLNIADKGFALSVYNRKEAGEETMLNDFLATNPSTQIQGFTELAAFVQSLERPRKILLMIKAGAAVDMVLEQLVSLLQEGDIVIDGGNSHYEDSNRRFKRLEIHGINFISGGVSGGEEGARFGPSIMPSGTRASYATVAPVLESIAAKDKNGQACCTYIGTMGAGHFVKMVHNGIEYAEMQLLAELFALLVPHMDYAAISDLFAEWNKGELSSYLLEITSQILRKKEDEVYLLDLILDKAGNKGTGSWSSKAALELGTVNNMMSSAVFARYISSFKALRMQLANSQNAAQTETLDMDALSSAYHFARIINHQQGFALLQQASDSYHWNLNLTEIARIWTNGCIIRSQLMENLIDILGEYPNLLEQPMLQEKLHQTEPNLVELLQIGMKQRIPLASFSAAYQYWIAMTSAQLPANLIQAQRDYFGAHTYQRVDADASKWFHTNW